MFQSIVSSITSQFSKESNVRMIDDSVLYHALKLHRFEEEKTNIVMRLCLTSDRSAQFVLGISEADWQNYTASDGFPPEGANWDPELKAENASIEHINSLVPGSISQVKALSKLRKIVKLYMSNVNIEEPKEGI